MQIKTKKKHKYQSQALERSAKSMSGGMKILQLVSRAKDGDNIPSIIASEAAVMVMQHTFGTF